MDPALPLGVLAMALALYGALLRRGVGLGGLAGFDRERYARIEDKGRFHRAVSNVFWGLRDPFDRGGGPLPQA